MRLVLMACVVLGCGGAEPPEARACALPDGRVYRPGDVFPEGDGCNSCHCFTAEEGFEPGYWGCTLIGCAPDLPRRACEPVAEQGCALGPACGDGCCGQGERCVDGACQCGDGPACGAGHVCGSPEPIRGEGCGVTCCPAEGPCG